MKKTKGETEEEETRLISKEEDEHYMRMALAEAEKAFAGGEVPVGAVLVHKISPPNTKRRNNNNSSCWRARTTRRNRITTHSRTRNWNASRVGEKR